MTEVHRHRYGIVFLLAVTFAIFAIRLTAPPDLMARDQQRPASYIMDVLRNGHWIVQTDWTGDITSKPPMYTWLSALFSVVPGRLSPFTLYLPCALATAGIVLIIFYLGCRFDGWRTGVLAGILYLCSQLVTKQVALARTDAVFSFMVALGSIAAFKCWARGGGWTWFWIAAAAATLTKGPLGLMLAAGGLLAAVWEWRTHGPAPLEGSHLAGILLFILLVAGWFALACLDMGRPVYDKMIGKELVGLAVAKKDVDPLLYRFWKPSFSFLTRFFPACILAIAGMWRVIARPAGTKEDRRLERFLCCWFLAGMIILSLATHHRADLLMPLIAPAAVLAGREIVLRMRPSSGSTYRMAGGLVLAALAVLLCHEHLSKPQEAKVQRTISMRELAGFMRRTKPAEVELVYVDAPYAPQFYLNTMQRNISPHDAAKKLAGSDPVWVVFHDRELIAAEFGGGIPPYPLVARWPVEGKAPVTILGSIRK